jgi:mono/diheme cytochrome c family protein
MPTLGLENQEVADVLNYVMNSWSNKQKKMITAQEVKEVAKR